MTSRPAACAARSSSRSRDVARAGKTRTREDPYEVVCEGRESRPLRGRHRVVPGLLLCVCLLPLNDASATITIDKCTMRRLADADPRSLLQGRLAGPATLRSIRRRPGLDRDQQKQGKTQAKKRTAGDARSRSFSVLPMEGSDSPRPVREDREETQDQHSGGLDMRKVRRRRVFTTFLMVLLSAAMSACLMADEMAGDVQSSEATSELANGEGLTAEPRGISDRCSDFCPSSRIQNLGGGCGCVNSARTRVFACDRSADGRGVTTWYISTGGGGNVGDSNGNDTGCGAEGPDNGGVITSFHVCVGSTCGPQIGPF